MPEPPSTRRPNVNPPRTEQSGGVNVHDARVDAGRDIAGRDIIEVRAEGFSASAVQKLLLTVGALVFFAALCSAVIFFSGGLLIGFAVFTAFNRDVPQSGAAAFDMQSKLSDLDSLPSGSPFNITFSEPELNSYVARLAPANGLQHAETRMLDQPGQLAIMGDYLPLGVPVAATFRLSTGDKPVQLQAATAKLLPIGNSPFGWVAVPNEVVEQAVRPITASLFQNVRFTSISNARGVERAWTVIGLKQ